MSLEGALQRVKGGDVDGELCIDPERIVAAVAGLGVDEDGKAMAVDHQTGDSALSNSLTSLVSLTTAGLGDSLCSPVMYEQKIDRGGLVVVPTLPPHGSSPYSAVYKAMICPSAEKIIARLPEWVSTFAPQPVTQGTIA